MQASSYRLRKPIAHQCLPSHPSCSSHTPHKLSITATPAGLQRPPALLLCCRLSRLLSWLLSWRLTWHLSWCPLSSPATRDARETAEQASHLGCAVLDVGGCHCCSLARHLHHLQHRHMAQTETSFSGRSSSTASHAHAPHEPAHIPQQLPAHPASAGCCCEGLSPGLSPAPRHMLGDVTLRGHMHTTTS